MPTHSPAKRHALSERDSASRLVSQIKKVPPQGRHKSQPDIPQSPYNSPMKRLADLSPNQLAGLTMLSGILTASIFLISAPSFRHHLAFWLPLTLAICAADFWLMMQASRELKHGIETEHWPAEQIEKLRSIVGSPFVFALMIILLIAYIALAIPSHHPTARAIGWAIYMPSQALMQLCIACRRPQNTSELADWRSFEPIQSEHWGNR